MPCIRLKHELRKFEFGAVPEGQALGEVRRAGKVVDIEQPLRRKVLHDDDP